jgi:hypothetical protein
MQSSKPLAGTRYIVGDVSPNIFLCLTTNVMSLWCGATVVLRHRAFIRKEPEDGVAGRAAIGD